MFDNLNEKFSNILKTLKGQSKISEKNIDKIVDEIKDALLGADVNYSVVRGFANKVKQDALGVKVSKGFGPEEQFIKIVHDRLVEIMGGESCEINWQTIDKLEVILVVGLNGQGKTTFCGKLANYLKNKYNKKVLLVPCDTYRPAAKEQLKTLAKQIDVQCFDSNLTKKPKHIAKAAIKSNDCDVVIIDTAGRLHIDTDLMIEIGDIKKTIAKYKPRTWMVADAMIGQEAVNIAKSFDEYLSLDGVILSKMDSDSKGGAALSISEVVKVPINYISTGEKLSDLQVFYPDRMASRILDMGDIVTLVEKAEEQIEEEKAEKMVEKMTKGEFSIEDFVSQVNMLSKLGPIGNLFKMLPGMGQFNRKMGGFSMAEDQLKSMKVIINSMTKKERKDHNLMDSSRIQRIAKGSGKDESQVRDFLNKFKQMKQVITPMSSMLKQGNIPNSPQDMFNSMSQRSKKAKKADKGQKGPWGKSYF